LSNWLLVLFWSDLKYPFPFSRIIFSILFRLFGRIKKVPIAYEVYVMLSFCVPRSSSCLCGNQTDGNRGCLQPYSLTSLLIEKDQM